MSSDVLQQELIDVSTRLLQSIADGDWKTYAELCDASLTAFEEEARGRLVEGLGFHKFYFDLERAKTPVNVTVASPHVRIIGDVGIVCYCRLLQRLDADKHPQTLVFEETRIWRRIGGTWKHIHFHRSEHC